jgi:hypothetical protein
MESHRHIYFKETEFLIILSPKGFIAKMVTKYLQPKEATVIVCYGQFELSM